MTEEYTEVSKDEFFAFIGPRDIVLRTEPNVTYWEFRDRRVVAMSTPGWKPVGAIPKKRYWIKNAYR